MTQKKKKEGNMTQKKKGNKTHKKKRGNLWMKLKYFTMKWRFRLDQARMLFGLLTFALILAQQYAQYIPGVQDPTNVELWIVVVFALVIFVVFIIGGYVYDRVFKLWTETQTVAVERNPYTYVPNPKELIFNWGMWAYLASAINQIADNLKIELDAAPLARKHMEDYYKLSPQTPNFEVKSLELKKISRELGKMFIDSGLIGTLPPKGSDKKIKDVKSECNSCGKINPEENKFCGECGHTLK